MSEKTEFGALVDSTDVEFLEHCADKNVGYVSSLRNQIAGAYQTLLRMKDDLMAKVKAESLGEDSEEIQTIKGIYNELLKLEHKSCLCVGILKERELKD